MSRSECGQREESGKIQLRCNTSTTCRVGGKETTTTLQHNYNIQSGWEGNIKQDNDINLEDCLGSRASGSVNLKCKTAPTAAFWQAQRNPRGRP